MGLLDTIKNAAAAVESEQRVQKLAEEILKTNETAIVVSTGGIPGEYEIVDAIFALDSHGTELFATADPAKAFDGLKRKLRLAALKAGGNAAINCQFEYRVAIGEGVFGGSKRCIELFGYGTAVRRPGGPVIVPR